VEITHRAWRVTHRQTNPGPGTAHKTSDYLHLLLVEFASHEQGMANSGRPETGEFAAFLAGISDSALTFRNLDVLREEDL